MRAIYAVLVSVLLITTGCGPVYRYTQTTQEAATTKPADCDFLVTATLNSRADYVEMGVLEPVHHPPRDIARFKDLIRNEVCAAGGDLVVGEINGFGFYVRGVVFKKRGRARASEASSSD